MPNMRISGRANMNLAAASVEGMVEMGRGLWGWMVAMVARRYVSPLALRSERTNAPAIAQWWCGQNVKK
jgi:hypothetical protein